jgi:hypothetical protein
MRIPAVTLLLLATVASLVSARPPGKGTMVPQTVEIDGCVLPADGCEQKARDVLDLSVGDRTIRFAVREMRVVSGAQLGASLLATLRGRPLRVVGPDDLTAQLAPGSRLRLRGSLRSGSTHMLFLQGVEKRDDDTTD